MHVSLCFDKLDWIGKGRGKRNVHERKEGFAIRCEILSLPSTPPLASGPLHPPRSGLFKIQLLVPDRSIDTYNVVTHAWVGYILSL